ncbi:MAG: formate--tetrahydrofolate ligase, partial [Malacoplasma sp.]|nr:formate--tetrahydrofolate ligase [Malacoplasma sp.]
EKINSSNNKLILVTSINPTPEGEGKTTTLIGLNDCLNYFGKSSLACLRQPSMGPFFGIKGGATGSGQCEILDAEKINCGFTGDFYEIEAANNLIMSIIENEIYFNSELDIDPNKIMWKRCIDINDRSLREIKYEIKKGIEIKSGFTITAASYLMALFCIAKNKKDFKDKLDNTIVAFNKQNKPIYLKELKISDAIMLVLNNSLKPNLAFSKFGNPIIIHGGPFANIAHGCNSLIALTYAINKAEYVFTEAGFGSELGAEKFIDILCREANLIPDLVVLTITLKAVKHHGKTVLEKMNQKYCAKELIDVGFENVKHHFNLLKKFNLNVCIIINKFDSDDEKELNYLKSKSSSLTISTISTMWQDGPKNNKAIFDLIVNNINKPKKINFIYNLEDNAVNKINKLTINNYQAKQVFYSDIAKQKINDLNQYISGFYICGAKTPFSISTSQNVTSFENNDVLVEDIEINFAAKFIIPIYSKVFLMPGLPIVPNAKNICLLYKYPSPRDAHESGIPSVGFKKVAGGGG